MGDVIPFPLERRLSKIAEEAIPVEYVQQPGWFGVRLRPEGVVTGETMHVHVTSWNGTPVDVQCEPGTFTPIVTGA